MCPRTTKQLEENRIATESKILEAALNVFSIQGINGASIRKIAREANVSDGLLYNYFKSKDELALAVMKSSFQTLDETIVNESDNSPEENFRRSVSNFIKLIQTEKIKIRLLAQMGIHAKKNELFNSATKAKYEESVSKFTSIFERMNLSNPNFEARMLVASLDGVMFESLLMDQPFDLSEFKESLINKYRQ